MKQIYKTTILLFLASISLSINVNAEQVENDTSLSELDCVVEPSEIVDIGSAVPGVLEAIHVNRSDIVEKNIIIAQLEAVVEISTVNLTRARADINTAIKLRQTNAAFGDRTEKRNQTLAHDSYITEQNLDQLETEAEIANYQVRQEKENKHIAELEYRRAEAILTRRTIVSPLSGVVIERFKSVGEYVEDEPILRLAKIDALHVEVILPMVFWGQIEPGMQAEVTLELPEQGTHIATVGRVDRVGDAASGTFGAQLDLSNTDYAIPSNIRCKLAFIPPADEETESVNHIGEAETQTESTGIELMFSNQILYSIPNALEQPNSIQAESQAVITTE
jgi:RND family efflux transporter MFP subunit